MLNERLHATRQVRAELTPAEEAADESYLSALKLGVALCEARRSAKLSIHTAQDGFAEIHAAISHAGLARARLLKLTAFWPMSSAKSCRAFQLA